MCALLFGGCGYIHFGRRPPAPAGGDAAMAAAFTNLSTENKILKQELALVRKQTDSLRLALERASEGPATQDLAARLAESSRELATLRASYAKLKAERAEPAPNTDTAVVARLAQTEEKLATSLRTQSQLEQENARLRGEIDRIRIEQGALTERLTAATRENEQARIALEQLKAELLTHKQPRVDDPIANRPAQPAAAPAPAANAPTFSAPPMTPPAAPLLSLRSAKAPPAGTPSNAELRANAAPLSSVTSPTSTATPSPAPRPRVHVVRAGDTLEKMAQQYFGAPERWTDIYEANRRLLGDGQPLRPGMELELPSN